MGQKEKVLEYLKANESITSWDAIQKMRITRLAAYICQLRDEGHEIESVWEQKKVKGETMRWIRYTLQK